MRVTSAARSILIWRCHRDFAVAQSEASEAFEGANESEPRDRRRRLLRANTQGHLDNGRKMGEERNCEGGAAAGKHRQRHSA